MHKRLRLVVPIVQTSLALGAFLWYKLASHAVVFRYADPLRDIVMKLNYPVVALWFPVMRMMDRFPGYFSPSHLATVVAGLIVFVLALLLSVALFWYLFLLEIEMRRQGRSIVRFSSWPAEAVEFLLVFSAGAGAFVYLYQDTKRLRSFEGSKVDLYVGGLLLVAWGLAFFAVAVLDLAAFLRKKRAECTPAAEIGNSG